MSFFKKKMFETDSIACIGCSSYCLNSGIGKGSNITTKMHTHLRQWRFTFICSIVSKSRLSESFNLLLVLSNTLCCNADLQMLFAIMLPYKACLNTFFHLRAKAK